MTTLVRRPAWVNPLGVGLATSLPLLGCAVALNIYGAPGMAVLMTVIWTAFVLYTITVNVVWNIRKSRAPEIRRSTFIPLRRGRGKLTS